MPKSLTDQTEDVESYCDDRQDNGSLLTDSPSLLNENLFSDLEHDVNMPAEYHKLEPFVERYNYRECVTSSGNCDCHQRQQSNKENFTEHFKSDSEGKNKYNRNRHIINLLIASLILLVIIWLVYASSECNASDDYYTSRAMVSTPNIGQNFTARFVR